MYARAGWGQVGRLSRCVASARCLGSSSNLASPFLGSTPQRPHTVGGFPQGVPVRPLDWAWNVPSAAAGNGCHSSPPPVLVFPGGAMYFWWQLGAVSYLSKRIDPSTAVVAGASAGSLSAALFACSVRGQDALDLAYSLALESNLFERRLGLYGVWGGLIREWLHMLLPDDAAERCRGRVKIQVQQVLPWSTVLIDDFENKDDLIAALMASIHIPFFLDGAAVSTFRGVSCIDGTVAASVEEAAAEVLPDGGGWGEGEAEDQAGGWGRWEAERGPVAVIHHRKDEELMAASELGDILKLKGGAEGGLLWVQGLMARGEQYTASIDREGAFDMWPTSDC